MKRIYFILWLLLFQIDLNAQSFYGDEPFAHTYSIVAYDPETGDIGVAVQSHWFSVGSVVAWAEAGVGAIATQSFTNPAFGPQGLALLKTGLTSTQTLKALLDGDPGSAFRQVGIIDAQGHAVAHTGSKNIQKAGHHTGENYAVQANLMDKETVWPAMARAFESATGPLAERMMAALEAAQQEGGDIRGKQSAALLVVSGHPTGKSWVDRKVDLRVDDHRDPLKELKRLYKTHVAYAHMNAGDVAVEAGDFQKAATEYSKAEKLFPDNLEMQYWHAVNLANEGQLDKALPMFKKIFARDQRWKRLIPRLVAPGVLNVDEPTLEKILKQ